jgi:hypothetical protein
MISGTLLEPWTRSFEVTNSPQPDAYIKSAAPRETHWGGNLAASYSTWSQAAASSSAISDCSSSALFALIVAVGLPLGLLHHVV